jgi:hypothetical protein
MQQERDDLHTRFENAILELQQKTGLKNVLLEKKLAALNDLLEQKEAQINEVLAAAHIDPAAMSTVNKKLEVQTACSILIHSRSYKVFFNRPRFIIQDIIFRPVGGL